MKKASLFICCLFFYLGIFSQTGVPATDILRLTQAIRFSTVPAELPTTHSGFLNWLDSAFSDVTAQVKMTPINGLSRLYSWEGSDSSLKPVLFLMHYDVVPIADGNEWTHPPFGGYADHEFIWGRGAIDNKGPMIAFFEAAEQLINKNFQPARTIYFAVHHDEETGGTEGAARIAEHLAGKNISFEFIMDEGGAIMNGVIPGLEKPVGFIATAEKGYADYKLSITAEGGHSSMPFNENSIEILSTAIFKINKYPLKATLQEPVIGMLKVLRPYLDGKSRLAIRHMKLFRKKLLKTLSADPATHALVQTTLSPTMFTSGTANNVIPIYAEANINARILTGETVESTREQIIKIIDDARIHISVSPASMDPSVVSPMYTQAWRIVSDAIREIEPGIIIAPLLSPAMSDSRHYKNLAENIYRFCPVVLSTENKNQIHGKDERFAINDYREAIRFYVGLLTNLGNGSK